MASTAKLLRKRARLIQLLSQIEAAQLRAEWDNTPYPASDFTIDELERIDLELLNRDIDPDTGEPV